jgi:hypothetical protein
MYSERLYQVYCIFIYNMAQFIGGILLEMKKVLKLFKEVYIIEYPSNNRHYIFLRNLESKLREEH